MNWYEIAAFEPCKRRAVCQPSRVLYPSQNPGRLVLVDGMSALYRCHYALEADERRAESEGAAYDPAAAADLPHIPPLTMEEATRARCVAFLHYLCTLQSRTRCSHLAVALDARGKNFRHELFNAYKIHRPAVPREVAASAQLLREALPDVGVPFLQVHGVEADDIIGTIAVQACQVRGKGERAQPAACKQEKPCAPDLSSPSAPPPSARHGRADIERGPGLLPAPAPGAFAAPLHQGLAGARATLHARGL